MAPLLKESGLRSAVFGIETLNHEAGKAIGKGLHPEHTEELLSWLRGEQGWSGQVAMFSGFIIGLPHETKETCEAWMSRVADPTFPLDSFMFTPLSMNIHPESTKVYRSQFELEYAKYGYVFDDPEDPYNWRNGDFTFNQAKELARDAYRASVRAGRQKAGAFTLLMLKNFGFGDDLLMSKPGLSYTNRHDLLARRIEYVNSYYERLMNVAL